MGEKQLQRLAFIDRMVRLDGDADLHVLRISPDIGV